MIASVLVEALLVTLVVLHTVTAGTDDVTLSCSTDADCDTVGAACASGACRCTQGRVMTTDLTRCLPGARGWGSACEDAVQCVPRLLVGGSCAAAEVIASTLPTASPISPIATEERVCQCAQGYHYLRGQCWKTAGLGEACKHPENCHANHDSESVSCSAEGKCVCAAGYYQREYSSCRRISTAFGQECGIAQDCWYDHAACTGKLCDCAQGYEYSKDAKQCVLAPTQSPGGGDDAGGAAADTNAALISSAIKAILDALGWSNSDDDAEATTTPSPTSAPAATACATATDCGQNADCDDGLCVCRRGYFSSAGMAGTSCQPELLMPCGKDADCTMRYAVCRTAGPAGTEGSASFCSCKGGYVASKDMRTCRKMSRELGWSCLHDEQCGFFGPSAACEGKRCRCAGGTHWVQAEQFCWTSKSIDESCAADEDCSGLGEGARCDDRKVCACKQDYHAAKDGLACRPDVKGVGVACEVSEDCVTENTSCLAGLCTCSRGYMRDASGNGCQSGVGGPCVRDSDCGASSSACDRGLCTCARDRVSSDAADACLQVVRSLGGECSETTQCGLMNANCTQGACACADEQHFRDGRCHPRRGLGESCASTSECFLEGASERVECRNSACSCRLDDRACSGQQGLAVTASMMWLLVVVAAMPTILAASTPSSSSP